MPAEIIHSSSLSSPSSASPCFSPSVLDWSETQVNQFFVSLGLTRFEHAIREHAITGDVLVHLDNDLLKDIGVLSVGKRLTILKAIYKLKLKEDIPIDEGHWVPPSGDVDLDELDESLSSSSQSNNSQNYTILRLIQSRDQKISLLESEVHSIRLDLQAFAARHLASNPASPETPENDRLVRQDSTKQPPISDQPTRSPHLELPPTLDRALSLKKLTAASADQASSSSTSTTPTADSSAINPLTAITNPPIPVSSSLKDPVRSPPPPENSPTPTTATTETTPPKEKDIHNPYKSFRVTLEDPCYKVLPAALKKYKIKEHYKNYVLFICYGKQERCLSYDEKPLLLFQKLKEANQNPVFTLRHTKDIESPISIALSKQAQRREANRKGAPSGPGTKRSMSGGIVEPTTGFCVAIYPYSSEGEDDFDVGVGDTFLIVGKSKGWWVVHRALGDGKVPEDKQPGWVPSGCVLETKHSFATSNITYDTPILPEHILSISSCTNAVMDYKAKGPDELSLTQGDSLRVYKKYNNWSYAINESHVDKPRGWTPSWLVGGRKESLSSSINPNLKSKPSSSSLASTVVGGHHNKALDGIQIKRDSPRSSADPELGSMYSGT